MVPQRFHSVDGHDGYVVTVLFQKVGVVVNIGFQQAEAMLVL